ncbi:MAG: GGDEF domain-containing protein [Xanthobacteraceae bacterium]
MLIFANSNVPFDLPTLCAMSVFVALGGGLLLLFAWTQHRSEPALAYWGLGYLIAAAGAALLQLGVPMAQLSSICAGNALICAAYGTMWAGARSFEGRRVHFGLMLAGMAIWIVACHFGGFCHSVEARACLACGICAGYVLLTAREVHNGCDRELLSRWPMLGLIVVHAVFMLARIPYISKLAVTPFVAGQPHGIGAFVLAFETMFAAFCLPFLRVSMVKERAELQQRKAALTDALTGIGNRRAFFEFGEAILRRTVADRRPAALLLFDLDRFKEINDTAGHGAGDSVLAAFSHMVAAAIGPGDLFARLGGEEFACLLVDAPMAVALQLAERLRSAFAAIDFAGLSSRPTVSVGVAMASEASRDLSELLAIADRALYRAKAEGRNRVAPAPLSLVEVSGEGARPLIGLTRPANIAAPMAG